MKNTFKRATGILPLAVVDWLAGLPSSAAQRLAHVSASARPVEVRAGPGRGLRFDTGVENLKLMQGGYERPIQEVLFSLLKPGDVFYDIGANLGFFTMLGAKLVGAGGSVYAFEPVPGNAATIQRNAALNEFQHVAVFQKAIAKSGGEAELILTDHHGGATLASLGVEPVDAIDRITVDTASLDDVIDRKKLRPPSVVKIDVEGAEQPVIEGMSRTIEAHRPILLYEVDDVDSASLEERHGRLDAIIRSHGYAVTRTTAAYATMNLHVGHSVAVPL